MIDDVTQPLYDYFTVQDIASVLNGVVSDSLVYQYIKDNRLPTLPGSKLIHADDAVKFILEHEHKIDSEVFI